MCLASSKVTNARTDPGQGLPFERFELARSDSATTVCSYLYIRCAGVKGIGVHSSAPGTHHSRRRDR